ncbi:MAG: HNH endonuclease [Dehalococcoidia bacterium]|nr:HNH endonuclease [Dehalococcoidia bacterium]
MIEAGIPRRPRGSPSGKHRPAGGRVDDRDGYLLIRMPEHPYANRSGYVREHRLVMEQAIGRYLRPEEVVHHRNGHKSDNRIENLQLYESNAAHKREDLLGNSWSKGDVGNPKRSYRKRRTAQELLIELFGLGVVLGREVRRSDLHPPNPSYRAVAHAFGSWRNGVALALEQSRTDVPVSREAAPTPLHPASRDGHDSLRGVHAA